VSAFDPIRYLAAKASVDDRALHRGVLDWLRSAAFVQGQPPPWVLELGGGIGTMPSRLFRWGVLPQARYTLVDADAGSVRAARERLEGGAQPGADACPYAFELLHRDLLDHLSLPENVGRYDLVVANAVLDLVDVETVLPLVWRVLKPGSPFWFSINFDGETIFVPELSLDRQVLELYHRSMDQRECGGRRAGHSRTGRRLLEQLPASGASIEAAGSSDWLVWPRSRAYPADEAYFLHCIVDTIAGQLDGHSELDAAAFRAWVDARHAQIRDGALCYVAHQLDVAGRAPAA
jgi:SAM-dependent methyltransferase